MKTTQTKSGMITLAKARRLFIETATEEIAKGSKNTALAWIAFWIGVKIAQKNKVSRADAQMMRTHLRKR